MDYFYKVLLLIALSSIMAYSQPLNNSQVKVITDTTIFPAGSLGSCHASTIVELNPGEFMAAWFAGSHEGANDVGIWISTFRNDKWAEPVEAVKGIDSSGHQLPCWNPVLFKTKNNSLLLFYKVGINPREWHGYVIRSSDNGKNWTKPEVLPRGFLGPIKDKPIQLSNGNILCPSSVEKENGSWSIHLEITNDNLSSWENVYINKDDSVGVIQPTILRHPDGKLEMLCRSRQNSIYQTWSDDNGLHWSKLEKTSLPNPNSGIDAVSLADGKFILVYNPLLHGANWFNGRNILNVAVSNDGINWKDIYQLENKKKGQFSYPAVIQASDKSIQITYTYDRETIKYVVLRIGGN
ncbi:MAG: exo-alpha-sialidase [Ignavibacteriaceae bacterium]